MIYKQNNTSSSSHYLTCISYSLTSDQTLFSVRIPKFSFLGSITINKTLSDKLPMFSPKYGLLHKHHISSPCPKHFSLLKESPVEPDYGASKEDIHLNGSIFSEEKPFAIDFLHNKDLGARKLPLNITSSSALIKIKLKEMPEEDLNEIALSLTLGVLKIKKGSTISKGRLLHLVNKMLLSAPRIEGTANQFEDRRFTQFTPITLK